MRRFLAALMFFIGISIVGCKEKLPESPLYQGDPVEDLIKGLDAPNDMTRLFSVNRLGELGGTAKKAVPALKRFEKKHPKFKSQVEASIKRIESGAPPK